MTAEESAASDGLAPVLARVRSLFDGGAEALAKSCAANGRLVAGQLDERQVSIFELAWANAELLGAETVAAALDKSDRSATGELDMRLSLLFCADAIASVSGRLDALYLDLGLDLAALHAFAADPAGAALRRFGAGADALVAAGRALVGAGGDVEGVGRVALDEPVAMAQDAFRRFAAEVVAPIAAEIHRDDRTVPETLLRPLREMGVFGLSVPQRYGGSAPDDRDDALTMVVVTEALSEASLAAAGSLITRPEILCRALLVGGSEEQKQAWLPRIAAGEPLCAIAITEPDFGSDVASLMLRATRAEGGFVLDGAKTWCTFAGKAGLLMVVARTDPDRAAGHRGLSVLLVEKPSYEGHDFDFRQPDGGRLSGKAIPTIGYRGMHSFDLSFERFFVPDENVVGGTAGLGRGFYFTMAGMTGGRLQTAARACGVMRAALVVALRYAGDRKVFGAPLADFPLTLAKLARMAARYAACRRLTYAVAQRASEGRVGGTNGGRVEASGGRVEGSGGRVEGSGGRVEASGGRVEASDGRAEASDGRVEASDGRGEASRASAGADPLEASLVKLLACRFAELVTREALQIHGGMGYAEESPVSRYFVDARVLSIFEGAEETLALKVVGKGLLEKALGTGSARRP